jgi:DNA-binding MarR family transcriptional regulator
MTLIAGFGPKMANVVVVSDKIEQSNEGAPDSHLVAWRLLLTVHAVLTKRIDRGLSERKGLSFADYDVLVTLNEASGQRLRLSELAELTLLSHSGISRCVTRLESEGLLKRERCETDGRGYYACLTKAGRKSLLETWPPYEKIIERDFSSKMTADQAEGLAKLLHGILVPMKDHQFHHVYPDRMTDAPG